MKKKTIKQAAKPELYKEIVISAALARVIHMAMWAVGETHHYLNANDAYYVGVTADHLRQRLEDHLEPVRQAGL